MVSKEQKNRNNSSLHDKYQLLRSITNSHAENETSIIVDASKYIKKLKQKVERFSNEITAEQSYKNHSDPMPMVTVESVEKGFKIKVKSWKNERGMLVCVLEVFEDLGLEVIEARVSCTDTFTLHAMGSSSHNNEDRESMDAEVVKEAVAEAIRSCRSHDPTKS